jgi:hypothetical protein
MRRLGLLAIIIGFAIAVLLHRLGPPAPAIFDGIPLPQAPYRYVSPPPDLKSSNQTPASQTQTLPVQNGQVPGAGIGTSDSQLTVFFGATTLTAPASATTATVTIQPLQSPPAAPAGFLIHGNVYRVDVTVQPGGGQATISHPYHVTMRYPPGAFEELQLYDGSHWHKLDTSRAPSGDPYASASASTFGDFAATAPVGAKGESPFASIARYLEGFGLLAFVVIFGIIAVMQELRRRRKKKA